MHISLSEAKAKLTDLVRRPEAGDEVILTRHRQPAVRLTPVSGKPSANELRARRRAAIDRRDCGGRGPRCRRCQRGSEPGFPL